MDRTAARIAGGMSGSTSSTSRAYGATVSGHVSDRIAHDGAMARYSIEELHGTKPPFVAATFFDLGSVG